MNHNPTPMETTAEYLEIVGYKVVGIMRMVSLDLNAAMKERVEEILSHFPEGERRPVRVCSSWYYH